MNVNDMLTKAYDSFMASSSMTAHQKECAKKAYANVQLIRNDRLRTRAGRAIAKFDTIAKVLYNPHIQWNPNLFARMSTDEQFNTISHEFAHIVDFYYRNASGHGNTWRLFHKACGGNGKRTHDIDTNGLHKNIRRRIVFDTVAKREYRLTEHTFNRLMDRNRFILMKTEIYNGRTLVACHTHATGTV